MSRREIAALACRILALWVFLQGIMNATGIVWLIYQNVLRFSRFQRDGYADLLGFTTVGGVIFSAHLIIALLIWWRASSIAARMVSEDPSPVSGVGLSRRDALAIGFPIAGACVLLSNSPALLNAVVQLYRVSLGFPQIPRMQIELWGTVFQAALGLLLMFGGRWLARLCV
jgi:hypothetical protein